MKISGVVIENGIFLAPMAGVTDYPFREICVSYGAECVVTEMVSAKAVCYGDKKTAYLATLEKDKRPAGIQIFGSEPYFMASAAEKLMDFNPDFFDINMGCPVKKVVSSGDGCALMRDPHKCGELVRAVKNAVGVPVTVKIRAGFDKSRVNADEVAKYCEDAGASAVFVHGRTREMMYSGKADRHIIKKVKQAVAIPVVGNGDVNSASDALALLGETGCDGVMVGRGCLGRPWLFAEIKAAFEVEGKKYVQPSLKEIGETVRRHIALQSELEGSCLLTLRKQLSWYTKGIPGSSALRQKLNTASRKEEFLSLTDEIFNR